MTNTVKQPRELHIRGAHLITPLDVMAAYMHCTRSEAGRQLLMLGINTFLKQEGFSSLREAADRVIKDRAEEEKLKLD